MLRARLALDISGFYDKEVASRTIKGGARMVLSGSDHRYLLAGARRGRRF